jgi:FKBP-type peptidyl-prolyl cis-trans isomerase 2
MAAKAWIKRLNGLAVIMALGTTGVWAQESKSQVVERGATVRIEYTIFDEQGVVVESNKGGDPASCVQGQGQVIPGVDRALDAMRVGEKKTLKLKPEDAYGQINPAARLIVPKEKIPPELVVVGAKLLAHAGRQVVPGRVKEIRQDTVVVDVNHPLAGKMITIEIEVIDITLPTPKPQLPVS